MAKNLFFSITIPAVMLLLFLSLASGADLNEKINSLFLNQNCNLINSGEIDASQLIQKFGLIISDLGNADCQIILDYIPLKNKTLEFIDFYAGESYFGEINYKIINNTPNLIILAKDKDTLNYLANFFYNFEEHKGSIFAEQNSATFTSKENYLRFKSSEEITKEIKKQEEKQTISFTLFEWIFSSSNSISIKDIINIILNWLS
jgi:hypothetical protein